MKKLIFIAIACIINVNLTFAQNAKSDPKAAQVGTKPKQVPVKMVSEPVPVTNSKPKATTQAPQSTPQKEAAVNSKPTKPVDGIAAPQGKPVMKKDGTPDKRYKENKNLKKDGTPDKRYKENKIDNSKK
jgi:hypothetical protein